MSVSAAPAFAPPMPWLRRAALWVSLLAALPACATPAEGNAPTSQPKAAHRGSPALPDVAPEGLAIATFAGGCFWCMEKPLDQVKGVISTTSGYTDRTSGEKKESTEWHRVVAYGSVAESIARLARKGTLMLFEGSMHTREYTDKNGMTKKSTELKARVSRVLAGGKNEGHGGMSDEEEIVF